MKLILVTCLIVPFATTPALAEWWEDRGCQLLADEKHVYCPPDQGSDPGAPALADIHKRYPVRAILPGQPRVRDRTMEEFMTREQLQEALRKQGLSD